VAGQARGTVRTLCGCCWNKTITIVGLEVIRKCECNPDAQKCPKCSRAACHCPCQRKASDSLAQAIGAVSEVVLGFA
jgi:hypothetical protein